MDLTPMAQNMGLVDNRIPPENVEAALQHVLPAELLHRMQHHRLSTHGLWPVLINRGTRYELRRRGIDAPWDVNVDVAAPDWYPSPVASGYQGAVAQAQMMRGLNEQSLTRRRTSQTLGIGAQGQDIVYQAELLQFHQRQTVPTVAPENLFQRFNVPVDVNSGAIPRNNRRILDSTPENQNAEMAIMNNSYAELHNLSPIQ